MLAGLFKKRAEKPEYIHIEGYPWQPHDWIERLNTPANRSCLTLAFAASATQLPNGIMTSAATFTVAMGIFAFSAYRNQKEFPVDIHTSLRHHVIDRTGKAMQPPHVKRLLVRTRALQKNALWASVSKVALYGVWYGVGLLFMSQYVPQNFITGVLAGGPLIAWPAVHFGSMALRCHKLLTRRFVFAANPTLSRVMPRNEALYAEPARPVLAQQIKPR